MPDFDVIVIGAGPAGEVLAGRAAAAGRDGGCAAQHNRVRDRTVEITLGESGVEA